MSAGDNENEAPEQERPGAIRLHVGQCTIDMHELWTITRFDGTRLLHIGAHDIGQWHWLGHSILAYALGQPWSPSLYSQASGNCDPDPSLCEAFLAEEAAVAALVDYANVAGIDLLSLALRIGSAEALGNRPRPEGSGPLPSPVAKAVAA